MHLLTDNVWNAFMDVQIPGCPIGLGQCAAGFCLHKVLKSAKGAAYSLAWLCAAVKLA